MMTTKLHVILTLSKAVYLNRSTVTHVQLHTSIYIELGLMYIWGSGLGNYL